MNCPYCGYPVKPSWNTCPVCMIPIPKRSSSPQQIQHWKTLIWLGAFADAEGSFGIYTSHDIKYDVWYPYGSFRISCEFTPEWKEIASYWQSVHGGTLRKYWTVTNIRRTRMLEWKITRAEELTALLSEIIPYLHIKKADAEKVATFLLHYISYKDKGRRTKEEALKLAEQLSKK